jgi:ATP-binding cassette, subfamily C (CFTR/MRP), member 1
MGEKGTGPVASAPGDSAAVASELPSPVVSHHDEDHEKRDRQQELRAVQSFATETSAVTRSVTGQTGTETRKPWYKTPNPLRWGAVPPVPEERQKSREHGASFWSVLTFQWMAPLMNVSIAGLPDQYLIFPTQSVPVLECLLTDVF